MQTLVRAGQDATFRGPYAPLPSCRVSQFLAASFARNRRFHYFPKFATFDGCASGVRDGDYSESSREYSLPLTVTVTQNRTHSRPSGRAYCFVFRVPAGYWGTPVGPTPHAGPAVHSNGWTALHYAADCGNRRMIRSLADANADVNYENNSGC
jgi:hypothetical protein